MLSILYIVLNLIESSFFGNKLVDILLLDAFFKIAFLKDSYFCSDTSIFVIISVVKIFFSNVGSFSVVNSIPNKLVFNLSLISSKSLSFLYENLINLILLSFT